MKKILAFCFLAILAATNAGGFSVTVNETLVQKGDSAVFSGVCTTNAPISVKVYQPEQLTILETVFSCPASGDWNVAHEIDFTAPTGNWVFSFLHANEKANVSITVQPSRESSLLVSDFFNDPPDKINRLGTIILDLTLREADAPVENAEVYFWDAYGRRQPMASLGDGIYRGSLEIPIDYPLKDFNLVIVSQRIEESERTGGEFHTRIEVEPAPIILSIREPKKFSFETGKPVEWQVQAKYWNGDFLEKEKILLAIADTNYVLTKTSDGVYAMSFVPIESQSKATQVHIVAQDEFGNSGELDKKVVITSGFFAGIYVAFFWIFILLIATIGFIKVIYPKLSQSAKKLDRPATEADIKEKIKRIQVQYYQEHSLSREEYREKLNELQKKRDELKSG